MGIVTPEAVVLEFRAAGLATRSLAKVVDQLLTGFAALIVVLIAAFAGEFSGSEVLTIVIFAVGFFVLLVLAPALCETFWNGLTPGKAMLGLRVVTIDGGPIAFRHALIRAVLQLIEIPSGIAVFVAVGNPRSQRLGDLAAGTFVINERAASSLTVPTHFVPPPGLEGYCAQLDVSRVSSEQFLLIRNFLLRVTELEAGARYALALRLATSVSDRCSPPPPTGVPPEIYLIGICAAVQERHGGMVTQAAG